MKRPVQYWTFAAPETVFSKHKTKPEALKAAAKFASVCDIKPEVIEVRFVGRLDRRLDR